MILLLKNMLKNRKTNLLSKFIKFYFTSSVLNMFRTLIHPSSEACDFSIVSPHWLCVLISMCVGVSVWLVGVISVWVAEASSRIAKINRVYSTSQSTYLSNVKLTHLLASPVKLIYFEIVGFPSRCVYV